MSRESLLHQKGNSPGVLSFNLDDSWTGRSLLELLERGPVSAERVLRPVRALSGEFLVL